MKSAVLALAVVAYGEDVAHHHRHHHNVEMLNNHNVKSGVWNRAFLSKFESKLTDVERAVDTQLRKDKAPKELRDEEKALLGNASTAIRHAGAAMENITKKTAGGVPKKDLEKDVSSAENEVEQELQKAGASADLIKKEKALLDKAVLAAHGADVAEDTKAQLHRTQKATQLLTTGVHQISKAKAATASGAAMLKMYAHGLEKVVKGEEHMADQLTYAEGQAIGAMQEMHVSSSSQKEVEELLSKAASLQRKELVSEKQDIAATKKEASQLASRTHFATKASSATSTAALLHQYTAGMSRVVKGETHLEMDLKSAESQAVQALRQVGAPASQQDEVLHLLDEAAGLQGKDLRMETQDLESAKQQEITGEPEPAAQKEVTGEPEGLNKLEEENKELKERHNELLKQHQELEVKNEQKLAEKNTKLGNENDLLREENAQLKQLLEVSA